LQDLADKTKLSKSYLNEIENGKKYPKHDKILQLAEVLNCKFDDLVSTKLDKNLAPFGELLQSDFFKEIPLDLFGINKNTLINIISEAPKQITAFINTLIEISQNYNLGKERFYFAVLRSFQELHDNYFPEIEKTAQDFAFENNLKLGKNIDIEHLEKILTENFGYEIKSENFENTEHSTIFVRFTFRRKPTSLESTFRRKSKNLHLRKRNWFQCFKTNAKTQHLFLVRFYEF
jgi:transcriptional regulator with XRE-family HTH domain